MPKTHQRFVVRYNSEHDGWELVFSRVGAHGHGPDDAVAMFLDMELAYAVEQMLNASLKVLREDHALTAEEGVALFKALVNEPRRRWN